MAITDTAIDALLAASNTHERVARPLESDHEEQAEVPSVAARRDRQFIHLPLRLFEVLAPLPGKALAVYQLLWRRYHMEKKPAAVHVTTAERQRCHLTRWQVALALKTLEQAGLIQVARTVGKSTRVTLRPLEELTRRQEPTS